MDQLDPLESLSRSTGALLGGALSHARAAGEAGRSVALVEGLSDKAAIDALAEARGRDLGREGTTVIAMAGATNIGQFLDMLGPRGYDVALVGLCDRAEEPAFRSAIIEAGLGNPTDRSEMASLGFFVCVEDLEDELIRALGMKRVLGVIEDRGELEKFRRFQNQPAQRSRPIDAQLRRFMGTKSGRKVRYGAALASALGPQTTPAPLNGLLRSI